MINIFAEDIKDYRADNFHQRRLLARVNYISQTIFDFRLSCGTLRVACFHGRLRSVERFLK
ncbi:MULTISPECIES: hypothetical protein [Nostoc]|uniref:Uncharacterized protein n=1 Tax=Nostoc paludosum FACHB-159 TaxID=2692908 RepID=A0ABR8K7J2_9NOSO|nr:MULTISPECIES: hypothetical protein [Nostoc]MBD2679077.1 hypothetical protein [Nostoc sp. FACHB-857]MBD2735456.1 hypothetical protein [Nostoc paludosum FACHB-159]